MSESSTFSEELALLGLFIVATALTPIAYAFLGPLDVPDSTWLRIAVPKLVFDADRARTAFGSEFADWYLGFRVFSFYFVNALSLAIAVVLVLIRRRGFSQLVGVFPGHPNRGDGPSFQIVVLYLAASVGLYIVNWVMPTLISMDGKGGYLLMRKDISSLVLIWFFLGLYSLFLSVFLAGLFEKVVRKNGRK